MNAQNLILCELLDSSSSEEEEQEVVGGTSAIKRGLDEDDYEILIHAVMNSVFEGVKRLKREKNENYVEETVQLYSDSDFLKHFRMSRPVAYNLIQQFENHEIYQEICMRPGRRPITAEKHILAFLWFAGHESSYSDVSDRFGITASSMYMIITRVTDFLVGLAPNVIRLPSDDEKQVTEQFFRETKKFPYVIGAVDGSHIPINKPLHDHVSYYTRKKRYAVHLQGTVNHEKKFIDAFVGYPGSVHDARVFKNSDIYKCLPQLCSGEYVILGDSAYPLMKQVLTPFKDNGHLTNKQKHFNRTLSSCRVVVEHCFGLLKQRFRKLYHCDLRNYERIVKFIYACCVLHNLCDVEDFPELLPEAEAQEDDVEYEEVYHEAVVKARRNTICDLVWAMK